MLYFFVFIFFGGCFNNHVQFGPTDNPDVTKVQMFYKRFALF